MRPYLVLIAGVLLVAGAGCEKKEEARKAVPAPPVSQKDAQRPVEATPPLPPPAVAPEKSEPLPKPGQAGDHSSPAFKAGGTPDPKK